MYPIENVLNTDTTMNFEDKYNNLANHARESWRTLSYAISVSGTSSQVLIPAQAGTYLLLPADPHGFLVYDNRTLEAEELPIISIETDTDAADVCLEFSPSAIPFEVVEFPRVLPNHCVDITEKPLVLNVLQAASLPDVTLHFFLHVIYISAE
jgi:hypothetical protein